MESLSSITLPAASVPVKDEADICVIGGSCTGVFAAVRAARLGKKVILVERMGKLGGVATLNFVSIWHSIYGRATGNDLLFRRVPLEETIGCPTYQVDIHHTGDDRIEFFRLDGSHVIYRSNKEESCDRWLPEGETLNYYRIPMSAIIPQKIENIYAAGRMLDADETAFGALRVMVNRNQCGEAAGVAAALCADDGLPVQKTDIRQVRSVLKDGGSILV